MRRLLVALVALGWFLSCKGGGGGAGPEAPGGAPPPAPTNLTATGLADRIVLTWMPAPGATTYQVFVAVNASPAPNWCDQVQGTYEPLSGQLSATIYEHITAEEGVIYCYRVRAFNGFGASPLSAPDWGLLARDPPPPPALVQASDGDRIDRIVVSWSPVQGALRYRIYRSTSPTVQDPPEIAVVDAPATQYDDLIQPGNPNSIKAGVQYWYWVAAENAYGIGDRSTPDSGFTDTQPPVAPAVVQASQGAFQDRIVVEWLPANRAQTYLLYRAEGSATGPYELIATVQAPTTSYDDQPTKPGVSYFYKVQSSNPNGTSDFSSPAEGWLQPPPPQNLTASAIFPDRIVLSWDPVVVAGAAVHYEIYKSATPDGPLAFVARTDTTSYVDPAAPNLIAFYTVRAVVNDRAGAYTPRVLGRTTATAGPPGAPTAVQASDGAFTDRILVQWNPPATGGPVEFFRIYRASDAGGPFALVGEVGPTENQFEDTEVATLGPGVDFYYRVRAGNAEGLGPPSPADAGWAKPATPTGLMASDGDFSDQIFLQWTPIPGFATYVIYRSTTAAPDCAGFEEVGRTTASEFSDVQIQQGTVYYYCVRAFQGNHESDPSNVDSGFALQAPQVPPPPQNVRATNGDPTLPGKVRITWDPVPTADSYQVYRAENPEGPFTPISPDTLTVTAFVDDQTDEPEKIGLPFYYIVRAKNAFGFSPDSEAAVGFAAGIAPSAPPVVVASDPVEDPPAFPDRVVIQWQAVPAAVGYRIYRAIVPLGPYTKVGEALAPETQFVDTSVEVGVEYYYKVSAFNNFGESDLVPAGPGDLGQTSGFPPCQPSYVIATDGDFTDRIRIRWPKQEPGDCGVPAYFRVYRADDSVGPYHQVGGDIFPPEEPTPDCPDPNEVCYDDFVEGAGGNVVPGKVYFYKVEAFDQFHRRSGLSEAKDRGFARKLVPPPAPPQGVEIETRPGVSLNEDGVYRGRVILRWRLNQEPDLDHYRIYKSLHPFNLFPGQKPPEENRIAIVPKDVNTYEDTSQCDPNDADTRLDSVCYGTRYYYVITAVSRDESVSPVLYIEGEPSAEVSIVPNPPIRFGWPIGIGTWLKAPPLLAQADDSLDDLLTPEYEAIFVNYNGRVWSTLLNGIFFPGPDPFGYPVPPFHRGWYTDLNVPSHRSGPAVAIIYDERCPEGYRPKRGDSNHRLGSDDCWEWSIAQSEQRTDGSPEHQIAVGGAGFVALLRYEGRWNNAPPLSVPTSPFYTRLALDYDMGINMGVVSASPVLADTVDTQGNPNPDGFPEVFAVTESGYIVGWYFRDTTGPEPINGENIPPFPDGIPDSPCDLDNFRSLFPQPCADGGIFIIPSYVPPRIHGFPVRPNPLARFLATPVVVDFNQDGHMDILAPADDGCIYGYFADGTDVNGDGLADQLPGFPVCPGTSIRSSPAVADLDGNGDLELVVGTDNGFLVAINHDGSYFWNIDIGDPVIASPAIADVDGDGLWDVVFGADDGRVYAVRGYDGCHFTNDDRIQVPGCPLFPEYSWPFQTGGVIRATPVTADVDGEKGDTVNPLDFIVGSFDGKLYALDRWGRLIPGWPIDFGAPISVTASAEDPDFNGFADILIGTDDLNVYLLEMRPLQYILPPSLWPWKHFHGDPARTGYRP